MRLYSARMAPRWSAVLLALTLLYVPMTAVPRQEVARQETAALTDERIEEFLRTARLVRTRDTAKGITGSVRATMTDGTLTHDVHIQSIDQWKSQFKGGHTYELNFRDSWKFNIAVYKLDRLLDLQLVPVSVERRWRDTRGAYTWWVDDVLMDEGERIKKNVTPPDMGCWNDQMRLLRMLDQLIDNADRNVGNMLITKSWRIWAIDHTRAFRYSKTPRNPALLTGIDRAVLQRLEALEFAVLKREAGQYITDGDIRSLLARRDGIMAHFKARGDAALYDRQNPSGGCIDRSID